MKKIIQIFLDHQTWYPRIKMLQLWMISCQRWCENTVYLHNCNNTYKKTRLSKELQIPTFHEKRHKITNCTD